MTMELVRAAGTVLCRLEPTTPLGKVPELYQAAPCDRGL